MNVNLATLYYICFRTAVWKWNAGERFTNITNSVNKSNCMIKTHLLKQLCYFCLIFMWFFELFYCDLCFTKALHIVSACTKCTTEHVYWALQTFMSGKPHIWRWLCDANIKMYLLANHALNILRSSHWIMQDTVQKQRIWILYQQHSNDGLPIKYPVYGEHMQY